MKMSLKMRLAVLAAALGCILPAHATTAYMEDQGAEFGTLDLTTGVFSPIVTETVKLAGMGFAPDGTLYGVGLLGTTTATVYSIDPATGAMTTLGTVAKAAIGATVGNDGLIYVMNPDNSAQFYTIDPSTLAVHVINASTGFSDDGLAALLGGEFYTSQFESGSSGDLLERIDPVSGTVTQVGTGLGFSSFSGANVDGVLYSVGVATGGAALETVDTSTGTGSMVALISGMSDPADIPLALAFETPEPGTGWLACVGFLALLGLRHRRAPGRPPMKL